MQNDNFEYALKWEPTDSAVLDINRSWAGVLLTGEKSPRLPRFHQQWNTQGGGNN